jgi:hypothetical protein
LDHDPFAFTPVHHLMIMAGSAQDFESWQGSDQGLEKA